MSDVIDVMGHLYPAVDSVVGDKTPSPRRLVEPLRVADPASQPNAEAKPLLDRAVLKDPGLSTSDVDQASRPVVPAPLKRGRTSAASILSASSRARSEGLRASSADVRPDHGRLERRTVPPTPIPGVTRTPSP